MISHPRKVYYLTGSRADFGLMHSTLARLQASELIDLAVIVTGSHLLHEHGYTVSEIDGSNLNILARINPYSAAETRVSMAQNIARIIHEMTPLLAASPPDILLLLGDRGEMLAGAIAALHLGINTVHIHGGERSGTVDEPIRHAISKLSTFHFVATQISADRLTKMGESSDSVFVTGAPGIDDMKGHVSPQKRKLFEGSTLDPETKTALFVFHPVVGEEDELSQQTTVIIDACLSQGLQLVIGLPNSDSGGNLIRDAIHNHSEADSFLVFQHFDRYTYLSWLHHADFIIGNSSSGIIEAASFNTPTINVGSRQMLRERNDSVLDVNPVFDELVDAINGVISSPRPDVSNIYGDGTAGERIVELMENIPLSNVLKSNAY